MIHVSENCLIMKLPAAHLDDRCGAASVFYALELLKDIETPGFTVVFSVQEELGERGAKTAAFNVTGYCVGGRCKLCIYSGRL